MKEYYLADYKTIVYVHSDNKEYIIELFYETGSVKAFAKLTNNVEELLGYGFHSNDHDNAMLNAIRDYWLQIN